MENNGVSTLWDKKRSVEWSESQKKPLWVQKRAFAEGEIQFIPLEIIVRLGVSAGSSFLRSHPEYKVGVVFEKTVI